MRFPDEGDGAEVMLFSDTKNYCSFLVHQLCLKGTVLFLYHPSFQIWPHDTKRSQSALQHSPWKPPQAEPTVHTSFQTATATFWPTFLPLNNNSHLFSSLSWFSQGLCRLQEQLLWNPSGFVPSPSPKVNITCFRIILKWLLIQQCCTYTHRCLQCAFKKNLKT